MAVIGMRGRISCDRRLFRDVGIAEIAVRQAADPFHVLHGDRPIEPELLFQLGLLGDVDHAGGIEQNVRDVAGHHPQHREHQNGNSEQRQEHQEEAPDQIAPQPSTSLVRGEMRARPPLSARCA